MRKQGISVALLITAALALAGCTTGATPEAEPTTPAPVVTPTVTETAQPAVTPGVQAFGGDCSAAMSDDQLAAIFGEGTTLRVVDASPLRMLSDAAGVAAGALACTWVGPTDTPVASAWMSPLDLVAPATIANPQPAACDGDGYGGPLCTVDVAVGDAWLSLQTLTQEQLDQVLPVLGDALVSEHPEPATRPADTWAAPPCSALTAAAQAAFPGDAVIEGYPSDNNPSGPYVDALAAYGSMTFCGVSGLGAEAARIYVFAGLDTAALTFTLPAIEVPGADAAYGADDTDGQIAVVGSNVIVVSHASPATARTLLAALIPAQTPRPADTDEESN